MKKLLALSIASSLISASAFAAVNTEISQASNNETSVKAAYTLENGLSFGGEYIYDFVKKHSKEATLATAWKFQLSEQFWIQPQLAATFSFVDVSSHDKQATYKAGNTYKAALKFGYDSGFGLYSTARYRYDYKKGTIDFKGVGGTNSENGTLKNGTHRTDLTVGYAIEMVDMSVNWVHKEGKVDASNSSSSSFKSDAFEFKLAYTGSAAVVPYAQYTLNKDLKWKNSSDKVEKENEFKLGVAIAF